MTLVLCPECRADVSDRASHCPRCGYPLGTGSALVGPAAPKPAKPARLRTYISRRFAAWWTVATGMAAMIVIAIGADEPEAAAAVGSFAVAVSWIPIWWKTRRAARADIAPIAADLERRIEERLQAAEEQVRHRLAELEDSTRQIMDLEERIDFAERLLTKYRDEQLPGS